MGNAPRGDFGAIVTVDEDAFDVFNMFDAYGLKDRDEAIARVREAIDAGLIHPGFGGPAVPEPQAPPPGEPEGVLLAYPNSLRSGILAAVVDVEGKMLLEGATVYFSDGVQHRFRLEGITLSKHRGMGILHGVVGEDLAVSVFEPSFLSDRQWHGEGSVHEVLLYGIPYRLEIGTPPPLEVPNRFTADGAATELLYFDEAAMILPVEDAPPGFYGVLGPVKKVAAYPLEVLGRRVTEITMTVARLGEGEVDVDIRLFAPDVLMGQGTVPQVGQQIQATIRLCARLWMANVKA